MKKLIYCAAALATALFAGSCQRELLDPAQDGSTVTFSVSLPEVATKAIGDGSDINNLLYAVYRTEEDNEKDAIAELSSSQLVYCINPLDPKGDEQQPKETRFTDDGKTHISLELIKNQKYLVLFWAQHDETWVSGEDFDLTNITYPAHTEDNPRLANSNNYEAFAGVAYVGEVTGSCSKNATLYRPFAQINLATNNPENYQVYIKQSKVTIEKALPTFNVATMSASGEPTTVVYNYNTNPDANFTGYDHYVAMNYIFANPIRETNTVKVTCTIDTEAHGAGIETVIDNVPVAQNYKTNIVGNLLTSEVDYEVTLEDDWTGDYEVPSNGDQYTVNTNVSNADEFNAAFDRDEENVTITLTGNIDLNALLTLRNGTTNDPFYCVEDGKTLTIDLNGNTLTAKTAVADNNGDGQITANTDNQIIFDVRGTMTIKNGTIVYQHVGENLGWNASTNIFHVEGGTLNVYDATLRNLGGSDMAFAIHLNNWSEYELNLNVDNSTLESSYIPVRVYNSGPRMNNVDIKNSTLKGGEGKYAFWVHNYTAVDFGSEAKAEAQKALLNLNIYNQGNTFSPDVNGIRYGFTNSIRTDAYGITKTVSEDGTEVTLGSMIENSLIRRGVAGDEENTTIKKVVVEEGVAVLYDRTFRRFFALEEVVLPSTLTTIGAAGSGVFQSCTNLKNIVIPESVKVLGKGSFQECSSLESINIPAGVTRIESDAFRATGLKSVEFHAGVTYFGAQAFRDCKQLTEVFINAPEFTMENNTFGIMAAPFTPMTIYVVNEAMKTYVESKLTDHAKTYITVVAPEVVETGVAAAEALTDGKNVVFNNNITLSANDTANSGYGSTGLILKGSVLNGNGKTLTVTNANGDYGTAIYPEAGTIKNLTVNGAFRGIFMGGANGDVIIDNVIIDKVCYTFNSDAGNADYGVYITNSTLNGWTSYTNKHKEVVFTNCSFGQGTGAYDYAFCRPYNDSKFEDCAFEAGYEFDTKCAKKIIFKNCTYDGVKITAENAATLKTGDTIFFYNGVSSVVFE